MALFGKNETLLEVDDFLVGEFDVTAPGCYRNVENFIVDVKPRRALYATVKSDGVPISVAVANPDGSAAFHVEDITEIELGPVSTNDNKDMGIFIGTFPGDKAHISLKVWLEKK